MSHKESQVLCWKSQPVCKGEDKRTDCFCASGLSSSSLPCSPQTLRLSGQTSSPAGNQKIVWIPTGQTMPTHTGSWFPNRTWSSRQSWVQVYRCGVCVYTRPSNFLLLSIFVPEIMIAPPHSQTMIINNYSRFSSESVQIQLLAMLLVNMKS